MKPDKFFNAMGELDEELVKEFSSYKKPKINPLIKYLSAAACFVLVAAISFILWQSGGGSDIVGTTQNENGKPSGTVVEKEGFRITKVLAKKNRGSFISSDTTFLVHTEKGSEEAVRNHLYISDAPEYSVAKAGDELYEVSLAKPLKDNCVVRLSYVNEGLEDDSWAFQTEGELSVCETYPRDKANTVKTNSVIELEFSYADTVGVEKAVKFEPAIEGRWSHNGRTWRFTPKSPLIINTDYRVEISPEVTSGDKRLDEGYSFVFSTYEEEKYYSITPSVMTIDGINTYLPDDDIVMMFSCYEPSADIVGRVELMRFNSYEDMIAFSAKRADYEAEAAKEVAFDFKLDNTWLNIGRITLKDNPGRGYYAARVYSAHGNHLFDWIIQVHPLSLYISVTERDVLAWAAKDGALAEGISIRYNGVEIKTNGDGTALLEDVTDGSDEIKYLLAGEEKAPLVMASPSFAHDNYPDAYIYTDKPRYKNDDTVRVWGVVPTSLFYDDVEDAFEVMIKGEKESAVKVTLDENGAFSCDIELVAHMDEYNSVGLYYKGKCIADRYFEVSNYTLNNYSYTLVSQGDYVYEGEDITFDVRMDHVSGIAVSGKRLVAKLRDLEYSAVTDESGVAHFTIPFGDYIPFIGSESYTLLETLLSLNINVYDPNFSESYVSPLYFNFYVLTEEYVMERRFDYEKESVVIEAYYIDTKGKEKLNNGKNFYGFDYDLTFLGKPFDYDIELMYTLYSKEREIIGTKYNSYLKINENVYSDDTTLSYITDETKQFHSSNGRVEYKLPGAKLPDPTETVCYSEQVITFVNNMHYKDIDGRSNYFKASGGEYNPKGLVSVSIRDYSYNYFDNDYYIYGYRFDVENDGEELKLNDKYGVSLVDVEGNKVKDAKLLYTIADKSFKETRIVDSGVFNITYKEEYIPRCNLAGAYFKDGVFHRIAPTVISNDHAEREYGIDIRTDKEEYSPGEKVKLDIDITAGKDAAKGTAVNISVVNEAVFVGEDNHSGLFPEVSLTSYHMSSYRDYDLSNSVGGWGGGGGGESEFGDTVYFTTAVTDSNGKCSVEFVLPEGKVTSYRITVHAADKELWRGVEAKNISASSNFFVQPAEVKGAKGSDDLCVSATLISDKADESAVMTFRLNETGREIKTNVTAGRSAFANFGKLDPGDYTITVSAASGSRSHEMTFPVKVESATLKIAEKKTVEVDRDSVITAASSPVTLTLYSEETGRYLRYIDSIEGSYTERFDTALAYKHANEIRADINGMTVVSSITDYDYTVYDEAFSKPVLAMLPEAEADVVLTALYILLEGNEYGEFASAMSASNEVEAAQALLLKAANGEAVLADLLYAKSKASEDIRVRAILSLGLAILGDRDNALELIPEPSSDIDGIRTLILALSDRDEAVKELDRLFKESPKTPYLGLAAVFYMKQGIHMTLGEGSVTVVCGEREIPVEISSLESVTLELSVNKGDEISFKDISGSFLADCSYESEFTPKKDEKNIEGLDVGIIDNGLYETSYITVSGVKEGVMRIALPNCFRFDSTDSMQEGVWASPYGNTVTVYINENASATVNIPVMRASVGEYTLEPVVLLTDGIKYYSQAESFRVD